MKHRVLGLRALNRALLERHLLLRRRRAAVLATVERLVGLQAQVPRDPYVALWSRLEGFRATSLSDALERRRAVRMTLLRGTLHLVSDRDALALRPVIQPVVQRMLRSQAGFRAAAEGIALEDLLDAIRDEIEERPMTRAELGTALERRWPRRDAPSLTLAMYQLPTVQVTPRGLWNRSGRSAFTTIDRWLGRCVETHAEPDALVLRYLAAFGPSTPADVSSWSGLAGMAEVLERLRPRLRIVRDGEGRELFDAPRAPLPDADTTAPVRFLPEYDNVLLGHADRARMVPPGIPPWTDVGWGVVLVDGFGGARWKLEQAKESATLRVEPFRRLTASERDEVESEGEHLIAFLAEDVSDRSVSLRLVRR